MFTQNLNVNTFEVVGNVEMPTTVKLEKNMDTGTYAALGTYFSVCACTFHC